MTLHTNDIGFAEELHGEDLHWESCESFSGADSLMPYLRALVPDNCLYHAETPSGSWDHVVLVDSAPESQFDILNSIFRSHGPPSGEILCIAGAGRNFHGFKGRPWVTLDGNLHLSALITPRATVDHPGVAFTVLAVVSVLQTLDDLGDLPEPATVKWVNDILIGSAKIGGVLAATQMQDAVVTCATLGIGLNVETTPRVHSTAFVPEAGSVRHFSRTPQACSLPLVFRKLMSYLSSNYRSLLSGGYPHLLEVYRSRSLVLGRRVRIYQDTDETPGHLLASGVVSAVGDDLELCLEHVASPVFTGRLELLSH